MTRRGNPPWARVRLYVAWGEVPEVGDELLLKSGRRYQVIEVRGKTLYVLVLPDDAPVQGTVIEWRWAPQRKSRV